MMNSDAFPADPPRDIALVTSSRADYGHCLPVVRALLDEPRVAVRLLVTGAHLSPDFGMTVDEIERDGLPMVTFTHPDPLRVSIFNYNMVRLQSFFT